MEQRKVSGNAGTPHLFADWPLTCGLAAPSEKNLAEYLRSHPHCEVYAGHEKPPGAAGGICEPESAAGKVWLPRHRFGGHFARIRKSLKKQRRLAYLNFHGWKVCCIRVEQYSTNRQRSSALQAATAAATASAAASLLLRYRLGKARCTDLPQWSYGPSNSGDFETQIDNQSGTTNVTNDTAEVVHSKLYLPQIWPAHAAGAAHSFPVISTQPLSIRPICSTQEELEQVLGEVAEHEITASASAVHVPAVTLENNYAITKPVLQTHPASDCPTHRVYGVCALATEYIRYMKVCLTQLKGKWRHRRPETLTTPDAALCANTQRITKVCMPGWFALRKECSAVVGSAECYRQQIGMRSS